MAETTSVIAVNRLMPKHERRGKADLAHRNKGKKFYCGNKAAAKNGDREDCVPSSLIVNWQTKRTTFQYTNWNRTKFPNRGPAFVVFCWTSRLDYSQW